MSSTSTNSGITENYFNEIANKYESAWGGGGQTLANSLLSSCPYKMSLQGQTVFHDNACGTGIVTRTILSRSREEGLNVKITATDLAEGMLNVLKGILKSTPDDSKVTVEQMDSQDLKIPDNTFDVSITQMGIMLMPDPDKALREIYRTLKPGGYCGLTTPQAVVHRDIAERVIKRLRGPEGTYDRPPTIFKADEFLESTQFAGHVESVGFEDVNVRVETIWAVWKGEEGRKIAVGNFANIYKNFIEFREGEEEKWESLWEEQCLEDLGTEDGGLKMGQPVNILWGKKPTK